MRRKRRCSKFGDAAAPSMCRKCFGSSASSVLPMSTSPPAATLADSMSALNPHGRVPVIEDGDLAVWESHAILRYLAARYDRNGLWSADPAERARVDSWMDWSQSTLQPDFLVGVFWSYYRTPESQRDWPAIRRSLARCAGHFRLLDEILTARPLGSRWRTFPPARRSIVISSSISNVPTSRT